MVDPMLDFTYDNFNGLTGVNRAIVPFIACGDLNGFSSDQTYPLPNNNNENEEEYISLDPTQAPITAPYKTALEMKRSNFYQP
jgi:tRNA (cytidine32/guanosine34-2'-O)-methyltransferase